MTYSPGANLYGIGVGSRPENVEVPHYDTRAPTTYDTNYPLGKQWVWPNNGLWSLNYLVSTNNILAATWIQLANGSGDIVAVAGTTNQITATTSAGTATLSIPTTFIAPGTISGSTLTATGGNITASQAASGLVLTPTVVGAGASPQTVNGRVGQVIFSGASIAAAATQTFVITNSAITGSSTVVMYELTGGTTGSALTVQSVTNSAGSSSIVVANGTGATTSTGNLTFTFLVLN